MAIDAAHLGCRRIELEVYADNGPAVALYGRHGFVAEGGRRAAAWRAGGHADTLLMARSAAPPPAGDPGRPSRGAARGAARRGAGTAQGRRRAQPRQHSA